MPILHLLYRARPKHDTYPKCPDTLRMPPYCLTNFNTFAHKLIRSWDTMANILSQGRQIAMPSVEKVKTDVPTGNMCPDLVQE